VRIRKLSPIFSEPSSTTRAASLWVADLDSSGRLGMSCLWIHESISREHEVHLAAAEKKQSGGLAPPARVCGKGRVLDSGASVDPYFGFGFVFQLALTPLPEAG
jgi:hypothetical protein